MSDENKKTILLVEDEALNAIVTGKMLERNGYKVIHAGTGEKAVETVENTSGINLVLMDIDLGNGIDGTEAADRILKNNNIPLVFLSSHTEPSVVKKTEGITSYGYVVKNSGETVLFASIRMAFKLHNAHLQIQDNSRDLQLTNKILEATNMDLIRYANEYRILFENAPSGIFIAQDNVFKVVNPAGERIIGYPAQQLSTESFTSFMHPDDRAMVVDRYVRRMKGEDVETGYQFRILDSKGQIKWIEITSTLILWDDKPASLNYVIDVTGHKLAKEALFRSEERYRLIFENSPLGLLSFDDKGAIEACNDNFAKIIGSPQQVLVGLNMLNLKDKKLVSAVQESLNGRAGFYEDVYNSVTAEKSTPVRVLFAPMDVGDGNFSGGVGIIEDITGQMQANDIVRQKNEELTQVIIQLEEKEYHYRALFENTGTSLLIIEEDTTISLVNDEFARMAGYSRKEIEGIKSWMEFVDKDELERMVYQHKLRREDPDAAFSKYEFIFKTGNGERLNTFIIITILPGTKKSIASLINITELKKVKKDLIDKNEELAAVNEEFEAANEDLISTNRELHESEIRYRAMFENTGTSMILIEDDMTISMLNKEFVRNTGYSSDEIVGRIKWIELVHPDDLAKMVEQHRNRRETGGDALTSYEFRYRTKSGEYRDTLLSIKLVPGTKKSIASLVDITEGKIAGEKIKSLLEEKELILKEVHHRIKNNMNTINSLLSLQADTVKDPSAIAALEDAGSRVASMMVLYDKLYCSVDYGELSIKEYFLTLIDEITCKFPNYAIVKIEKQIEDFTLDADILSHLGIIINELLTNMMKYAFAGRENGVIIVTAVSRDNNVSIVIQDNGVGLPESINLENSTGFGLQLVSMLAQQIGGSIKIERGGGTRFVLEFEIQS